VHSKIVSRSVSVVGHRCGACWTISTAFKYILLVGIIFPLVGDEPSSCC
jgi:hypothetical protein